MTTTDVPELSSRAGDADPSGEAPASGRVLPGRTTAGGATEGGSGWRERLGAWVTSGPVQRVVITLIIVNAVTLGLETSSIVMDAAGGVVRAVDTFCLAVFVVEIGAKLVALGPRFFKDGWNVFDLLVVGIALVPSAGPLSVLRSLRVLRVLRLVSALPRLRFIVEALMHSLPGIGAIALLLGIIFYVSAVMATSLFGGIQPEYFGELSDSLLTLFQIMTLDSWAGVIVRPIMETQPWAWVFFVVFILLSAFTMLNLFIAVIVDTMQSIGHGVRDEDHDDEQPDDADDEERAQLADVLAELRALRAQVEALPGARGDEES
ncbi:ion transporter [Georgenia sp. Z1344]|uniref:ion transporter n=1 Tax=Georgenia sp. Z1344 TaxID=3416706 RepID=UPI003CEE7AE0